MEEYGGISFTGVSGDHYHFDAFPWDTEFKCVGAVYFITKHVDKSMGATHERFYVGQTRNLSELFNEHHNIERFDRFIEEGANCICVYLDPQESSRLRIMANLIDQYHPPCND